MQGLPRVEGNTPRSVFCLLLEEAVFAGTAGTPRFRLLSMGAKGQPLTLLVVLHARTLMASTRANMASHPYSLQEKEGVPCLLRKQSSVSPLRCEGEARNLQRQRPGSPTSWGQHTGHPGLGVSRSDRPGTCSAAAFHLPVRKCPFQGTSGLGPLLTYPSVELREASILFHLASGPSMPTSRP